MATTGSFFTVLSISLSMIVAGNKKAPDHQRRGASGWINAFDRLRAHASRGPEGFSGFGGAFGGRDHGPELMRQELSPRQRAGGGKSTSNAVEQEAGVAP